MSKEWIDLPASLGENYPKKVGWYDNSILLRYSDDSMTLRIEDADRKQFQGIKDLKRNAEIARIQIKLLSIVEKSDHITQIGSRISLDEVPERFGWNCPNCPDSTFQMRGEFGGKHAVCISCGQRMSVIIDDCCFCGHKSIFVKKSACTEDWYQCFSCEEDLD